VRHVVAVALLVTLTGCGSAASSPPASTGTPSTASAQQGRPGAAALAAFVAAFRVAYPPLAEGREDRAITNDAKNTCGDVRLGVDETTAVKHVAGRFGRDGATLPTGQATAVYRLVRANACP
jgi:predicted small lipoprotein YifL